MCKGDKSKNDETAHKCNKNVTNQIQKYKIHNDSHQNIPKINELECKFGVSLM